MNRVRLSFLVAALSVAPTAFAKALECWLPSSKDGSELDRLLINMTGSDVSIFETKSKTGYQAESKGSRTVLFHQFTDPRVLNSSRPYNAEQPHSVILTRSNYKGEIEFAADIVIVNWGIGSIKTASGYNESFNIRWRCTRRD